MDTLRLSEGSPGAGPALLSRTTKPQRTLDEFVSQTDGGDPGEGGPPENPEDASWAHVPEGELLEATADGFVQHPLLRPRALRAHPFQLSIARAALAEDVLVVLPTGLGKTVIAALVAAERRRARQGKVLMLAPTRPLVEQHARSFSQWFRSLPRTVFTGTVSSPRREGNWDAADFVFATPQVVLNDLQDGAYSLVDVGLLIFDEAHRAVGNYAYVKVASIYRTQRGEGRRVLGLTASPGGQEAKIREVLGHLGITRAEARSPGDPDVQGYLQSISMETVRVKLPAEVEEVRKALRGSLHEELVRLQRMGFLRKKPLAYVGVKDLVETRGAIMARPGPMGRKFGAMYRLMLAIHLQHSLELLETQGVAPFLDYLKRLATKDRPGRADRAFLSLPTVQKALTVGRKILEGGSDVSHPKLAELARVVAEEMASNPKARILVFAQFRDTIRAIQATLRAHGIAARRFVGQATRNAEDQGMKQREQVRLVEDFREGRFPVLVASSVAEEGLDIPNVDLVVFYEALPSEIRTIQRRGRTGRNAAGKVVVLMASGTRDEGYQRAERKRESAMRRHVRRMGQTPRVSGSPSVPAPDPS